MRISRLLTIGVAGAAVGMLGACSSEPSTTTSQGTTATTAPACPSTSLTVTATNGTSSTVTGPTAVADLLLRNGRTGNFNMANYAIPDDQAYGVSSAGNLTGDQVLVSFALTPLSGKIDPGSYGPTETEGTPTTAPGAVGTVSFFNVSTSAGVQTPLVHHTVVLTAVSRTQVCGTITPGPASPGTTAAGSASVRGSFTTNRIYNGEKAAIAGATTGTTTGSTGTTAGHTGTTAAHGGSTSTTHSSGTSSTSTTTHSSSTSSPSTSTPSTSTPVVPTTPAKTPA